jgi:hypothetical protein
MLHKPTIIVTNLSKRGIWKFKILKNTDAPERYNIKRAMGKTAAAEESKKPKGRMTAYFMFQKEMRSVLVS